jgi:predicted RNA-binding protein YlxR (DUF448 family)
MRSSPVRMCVGCRRRGGKGSLVRVVRAADGSAVVDRGGTAPGRGAYVHADPACVEAAFARGALLRALRAGVGSDGAARLRGMIEQETRSH